jgi:hypothetical protein
MNRNIVLSILIVLALLAGAIGIGAVAFRAGVTYGISQSDDVAAALESRPDVVPVAPYSYYGYGPFARPHFFSFGFGPLSCLFPLLFFFLLFGLFRFIFRPWGWGWHRGWHHGHGPWGKDGLPPMFEEWHKRAHGQSPSQAETPSAAESQ